MTASISTAAADLAQRTSNAYSVGRYRSWRALAATLLRRGYSEQETEAVLRSKWTRWAADSSDAPYGRATARDLERFLDSGDHGPGSAAVAELVDGIFVR